MLRINRRIAYGSGAIAAILLVTAAGAQQPAPRPSLQRQPQAQPALPTPPAAAAQATPTPPAAPAQPTLSTAPQRTTATYDDWIVQCETQAGPPSRKVCGMAQLTQLQVEGKTQPFSRVVVPQRPKDQPSVLIVQLPVNVSFATNVQVQTSDGDPGLAAPFARCVPDGCFADFTVREDTLGKFRSAGATGKLSFADASGRPLSVPLSFNGFGKAFDALMKE